MMKARTSYLPLRLVCATALCLSLALLGCGGGTSTVSGTVSINGQTPGNGSVTFKGKTKTETATIQTDGTYKIGGLPRGEYKVGVTTQGPGDSLPVPKMEMKDSSKMPGSAGPGKYVPVPPRFQDPEQSGIVLKAEKGSEKFNIDIQGH